MTSQSRVRSVLDVSTTVTMLIAAVVVVAVALSPRSSIPDPVRTTMPIPTNSLSMEDAHPIGSETATVGMIIF